MLQSLSCAAENLQIEIVSWYDPRLDASEIPGMAPTVALNPNAEWLQAECVAPELVLHQWLRTAETCDASLLVLPECDGLLNWAVSEFRAAGITTLNCKPDLIGVAADKWQTAKFCKSAGIPHPPTQLESRLDAEWLEDHQSSKQSPLWVAKPRLGAGCDGIELVTGNELERRTDYVVQPWFFGQAFSQSAIVDQESQWHWLPPTTQQIARTEKAELQYQGGSVQAKLLIDQNLERLREQLETAVEMHFPAAALGWLSFDLIRHAPRKRSLGESEDENAEGWQWVLVEINPRCSSSFSGLLESCSENLAKLLLQGGLEPIPRKTMQALRWTCKEFTF